MQELSGHTNAVGFLRLSAGGTRLYTSSFDKTVRLWALPSGESLGVVKVGASVLDLAVLPTAADHEGAARAVFGCSDGTVRLWSPDNRKASKALATLRFAHKLYVGQLKLSADGSRLLSCSRDGETQLWKRDEKLGFAPDDESLPGRNVSTLLEPYWQVELLTTGLLAITKHAGAHLYAWGSPHAPRQLLADRLRSPLLDSGACSHAAEQTGAPDESTDAAGGAPPVATSEPSELLLAMVGWCEGAAPGVLSAHVHHASGHPSWAAGLPAVEWRAGEAASAPAPPLGGAVVSETAPLPAGWARWCEVASEEGVTMDAALQQRLCMMESVAAKAGRELAEASVRAFLKRSAPPKSAS